MNDMVFCNGCMSTIHDKYEAFQHRGRIYCCFDCLAESNFSYCSDSKEVVMLKNELESKEDVIYDLENQVGDLIEERDDLEEELVNLTNKLEDNP